MFSFLRENARWVAGGLFLTMFSSFGQTFFISLSAGDIRHEYGLTNGEWGSLYMLATLASALTLPHLGRMVDYFSVAKTALIIMPLLALFTISMALSTHIIFLVITIYGLRLFGQGMMSHTAITAMGRWYAAQRGRAISVVTLGHQVGEALLPSIFIFIVAVTGWRNSWLMAALLIAFVGLPLIFMLMRVERVPHSKETIQVKTSARDWTRPEVLRDGVFWLALMGILAPPFIGTTIFFHQVYLTELRGWSIEIFAASFIVMSVTTIVFALICGYLVDRFSAIKLLPMYLLPLGFACLFLSLVEAQWSIIAFMFLQGVSNGFASTLFGAAWPEIYGVKHLGSIRSVIIAMMVFATALGPGITGILIDYGVPYSSQILTMGIYAFFGCGIMVVVQKKVIARQAI